MNLEPCFLCSRPVLELRGQFAKLDTFYLDADDTALAEGAFGWCHFACLSRSHWGTFWRERLEDRLERRGYQVLARSDALSALEFPRTGDLVALRADGVIFATSRTSLAKSGACDGGVLVPVEEEMNLELDDAESVDRIRAILSTEGQFPLLELVSLLHLDELILFPHALENGVLRHDESLREYWVGRWVSARAEYAQFIPHEVLALLPR